MEIHPTKNMPEGDVEIIRYIHEKRDRILQEIAKEIVGQQHVIEELLIALFAGGHALIVGVPGLAKTTLIRTFSKILDLKFRRIQFTPDLMPSDITGTEVLEENRSTGERNFRFLHGPLFANIILADEINRTPPKTQAALLEAMQENRVTVGGVDYPIDSPFFVLATQNPIEQEGTYPLPEAQLDRFMFQINIDYPSETEEIDIVKNTTSAYQSELEKVMSAGDILNIQQLVRRVPVSEQVIQYAVRIVKATRPKTGEASQNEFVQNYISWGAGPRASQYLILAGKVRAILEGRYSVSEEDVRSIAYPVLRHRLITNYRAEADRIDIHEIIHTIIRNQAA
ncbi:MAG: MoxR family ATPase [Candidatus Omnitrophota bacterium]|jgi:MoxR-like ATPase|nr:MAG: MoxR family ATPase [Candidatus Omnitrophota bacterium]